MSEKESKKTQNVNTGDKNVRGSYTPEKNKLPPPPPPPKKEKQDRHMMKTIQKDWHLIVLLLAAATVNENLVQWALAVQVGGHTVAAGFEDAFEYFTLFGYLFFTAFRLVPYVGLGIILVILSKTKLKDYVLPVFIGGLIGILAMIIWGSWMALRPLYTDEHVSSTTALAFLFIPIYAVPPGVIGAALFAGIYTPIRFASRKVKKQH